MSVWATLTSGKDLAFFLGRTAEFCQPMSSEQSVTFKVASEEGEFEQIFRLNYQTFVEEIPQHAPNPERRLVDRFHDQNTYLVALAGKRLVGMMAVRERRPFSLDEKLADLDQYLPSGQKLCEIRLLSVVPAYRNGRVLQGLLALLLENAGQRRCDLALISGTVRQLNLYRRLGFIPFGPVVGPPKAQYQPMYLNLLESYLQGIDFRRLRPFGAGARLHSPGWMVHVLADPGREYALLLTPAPSTPGTPEASTPVRDGATRSPVRLELDLPPGHYGLEWLEPASGQNLGSEHHHHAGGVLTLTAPVITGHLAVRLKRSPEPGVP